MLDSEIVDIFRYLGSRNLERALYGERRFHEEAPAMTLAAFYLVLALLGLTFSAMTLFRVRLIPQLTIPTFVVGWLRGELAVQTILFEAIVTLGFWRAGVFESAPGQIGLALTFVSWGMLGVSHRRGVKAGEEFAKVLDAVGVSVEQKVSPFHGLLRPFSFKHPDVKTIRDVEYGESLPGDKGGRNLLDVVLPKAARAGDRRPVLLQVHGGGWIIGDKREQAKPLMTHLASKGWICVSANYRLSPKATMPDQIVDVKRAIAWIRSHIEEYGGDPDFLCITGGSAGGHLCSLAALTPNDPRFQPGFEDVDTTIDGCVPFYGVFDFLDRADDRPLGKMGDVIGPMVFKCTPEENPELWDCVSPVTRVHSEAPPFFVIQGSHDSLVFAEEAVTFVSALREKSVQPVLYVELNGAQHAFEIFHSPRTAHAVHGVTGFLEKVYADHQAKA
jgi:acetyl esterase/lipase